VSILAGFIIFKIFRGAPLQYQSALRILSYAVVVCPLLMKEERSIGGEKTMSSTNNNYKLEEGDDTMMCCDCCGIAVDDIKVKTCSANKLVRYCSIDIDCQKDHRPKHKKA
jgi:hypothetical protein